MWWNGRFASWMCSRQICSNCVMLSCQYGPKSLRNVSNTLLNLFHGELRQFWRQKRVQPSTSKVYLIKWPVSVCVCVCVDHFIRFNYNCTFKKYKKKIFFFKQINLHLIKYVPLPSISFAKSYSSQISAVLTHWDTEMCTCTVIFGNWPMVVLPNMYFIHIDCLWMEKQTCIALGSVLHTSLNTSEMIWKIPDLLIVITDLWLIWFFKRICILD